MAKKKVRKVEATQERKFTKPVRLDLKPADHERLESLADSRGLSMASLARMLLLKGMTDLEREG
jgi:hypothetical protein